MNRQSFQQGHVQTVSTRQGEGFKIKWRIRLAGVWKWKSETHYDLTKKQAKGLLADKIRESAVARPESATLTFVEFVEADWKSYLERKRVKPSTRKGYECVLKAHLLPALESRLIREIQPMQIEGLVQEKMKAKLSPRTIRNILVVLQSIFSLALDNDVVDRSPVRKKHKPEVPRTKKPMWTAEQTRSIVFEVPETFRALFTLAALTGMRIGEMLALQWKHMDFEKRMLHIVQSLWEGQLVAPKTKASNRSVLFGQQLADVLTQYKVQSQHTTLDDFVFCKPDGTPLNADVLRRDVLYPAVERLRLPRSSRAAGFHAFRHSAASLVNEQTGNLKLAQRLLGHADISTTADVYTHTTDEAVREAAVALERAIFGDMFPTCSQLGTGTTSLVGT